MHQRLDTQLPLSPAELQLVLISRLLKQQLEVLTRPHCAIIVHVGSSTRHGTNSNTPTPPSPSFPLGIWGPLTRQHAGIP